MDPATLPGPQSCLALCPVSADLGSRTFQDPAGLGCSRLCGAHRGGLATVPIPGLSVLLLSCPFQLRPSLGSARTGREGEAELTAGSPWSPHPRPCLLFCGASCLESQPPGAHLPVKQSAQGRGELHPRGRPGFPDSPGGCEVVQACLLTSPAQGRGCVSRKIISHFRPRSQNKLTQSHQRPGPPDF